MRTAYSIRSFGFSLVYFYIKQKTNDFYQAVVWHFSIREMTLLSIILAVVTGFAFGQNTRVTVQCEKVLDTLSNKEIYSTVDTQAEVIGGLSALYEEIATLKIPIDPDVDQIRIFISFIVEANGDITGFRTINKIASSTLDKELLQLIRKYKWEPGTCKGVKVPTRLTLKVVS